MSIRSTLVLIGLYINMKQKLSNLTKYSLNCFLIVAIAFTLSILTSTVLADWNEPDCTDPDVCNVLQILSSNLQTQFKQGKLNLAPSELLPDPLVEENQLSVYANSTNSAIYAEQKNLDGYAIYASGRVCNADGCLGEGGGSTAWGDLTGVPAGFADGVDNTSAIGIILGIIRLRKILI